MDAATVGLGTTLMVIFGVGAATAFAFALQLLSDYFQGLRAQRRARIEAELDAKQEELRAAIHQLAWELHQDAVRSGQQMKNEANRLVSGE